MRTSFTWLPPVRVPQQGLGVWSARTAEYPGKVYDRGFARGAIP
eukprot:SAG31_NODE_15921_length_731_cov_2.278481_2_plen_43_part_01